MATLTIEIDLSDVAPGATAGDFIDIAERCVANVRKLYPTAGATLDSDNVYEATKDSDHSQRVQAGTPNVTGQTQVVSLTSVTVG